MRFAMGEVAGIKSDQPTLQKVTLVADIPLAEPADLTVELWADRRPKNWMGYTAKGEERQYVPRRRRHIIILVLDFFARLLQEFNEMPITENDRDKTEFTCYSGLYQFSRIPFGLTNAPATFQKAINIILSRFRWKSSLVYLDDIMISRKSWEEHMVLVDEILFILERAGGKLKLRKCESVVEKIEHLSHVVRPGRLEVEAASTAALE